MSRVVRSQEGRALRERTKGIELERKNIILLSVAENRPLTMEEVDKIFKLDWDHKLVSFEVFAFITGKYYHS